MVLLNLGAFSYNAKYLGDAAKPDLFGANFLFNRDGSVLPGGVDENYVKFVQEAQVSTLRYPGGTLSETRIDLANPDAIYSNFMDPDSETDGPIVPLNSFLELCKTMNVGATIVLPTYRFLSDAPDATGHRQIDASEEANLRAYVNYAIQQSVSHGTKLTAFEIGNEWHVDNSEVFGFRMSPIEYGRIVNYMGAILQDEIDSLKLAGVLASAPEPAIVVQVGPGGDKEHYTVTGFRPTEDYNGPSLTATELIVKQITDNDARKAIDGVVMHRYMTVSDARAGDWVYSPFKTWDAVTSRIPGFKTVDQYVSEWNVSARNKNEQGLKQFDSMFEMIREMLLSGVDHADVWAVQQNNRTSMIANTGADGARYGGLTFGGIAFDIASTQLRGLKTLSAPEEVAGISINAFGSTVRSVIVLTNRTDLSAIHTVNLAQILQAGHHVTVYKISEGPDGKPTVLIETLSGRSLNLLYSLRFNAQESIVLVSAGRSSGTTIEGYDRNDILSGSSFADTILGGDGDDTCRGGTGNDTILGEDGEDYLYGEDGNDTLDGGLGNDVVDGGAGDDLFIWSSGNDTISGGPGNDVISFQSASGAILLDLRTPQSFASLLGGSVISGIDGFAGSSYNDVIAGAAVNDLLFGSAGCDLIYGGDENDTLLGGDDSDTVFGDAGNDTVDGEAGSDLLNGGSGHDTVNGGSGDDSIAGGDGGDHLIAGDGSDSVVGDIGNDVIYGDRGADFLFGGDGLDSVFGGEGRDYLCGDDGNDYLGGNAEVDSVFGGGGSDTLVGGAGNDFLFGGLGNDSIGGGAGDDILHGEDGNDTMRGTDGIDNAFGGSGDDILFGGGGFDFLCGDYGSDLIYGGNDKDHIIGGEGKDSLYGGSGSDFIVGGLDTDLIYGGAGYDTFIFLEGAGGSTVMDFQDSIDTLRFSRQFYDEGMSVRQFVDTYASRVGNSIVFDFGEKGTLTLPGLKSVQQLYDDVNLVDYFFY
jgi:Ca2+-binding RTX toxin-like protein